MHTRTLPYTAFLCAVACSLLAGCMSKPEPTRYYTLGDAQPVSKTVGKTLIALGPMEIPEYLNRQEIVIRDDTNLALLRFDHWAEPLNVAVKRHLADELNVLVDDAFVYPFPALIGLRQQYQISGVISAFEANQGGEIRLTVRWGIISRDKSVVSEPRKSTYTSTLAGVDDITAVTAGMTGLLDEFAADIAAVLTEMDLTAQ